MEEVVLTNEAEKRTCRRLVENPTDSHAKVTDGSKLFFTALNPNTKSEATDFADLHGFQLV